MPVAPQDARTGVAFELDAVTVRFGRLVVTGRWTGVRGMRFVRPALVVGGRQTLATLDDKPWAPVNDPWRATFRWDGGAPELDAVELAVAPSVIVPLGGGPARVHDRSSDDAARSGHASAPTVGVAVREKAATPAFDDRRRHVEAEEDRGVAERTARRLQAQRDAALRDAERDREAQERALSSLRAERDEAVAQAARLRVERDAALRGVVEATAKPAPDVVELWAMRVVGTGAAACLLALLVGLLRVVL